MTESENDEAVNNDNDQETATEPSTSPDADESAEKTAPRSKRRLFIFGGTGLLILIIAGIAYWLYARQYESTDDAFIEGDIIQVSPKVAAYVKKIYVNNNQFVKKGDPLIDLDTADLEAKLEQAKAQLANALSQQDQAKANVDLTKKTTTASGLQARSNVQTAKSSVKQNGIAADAKRSQITQAEAAVKTAMANLAQTRAQVPQAESNVRLAEVEYGRRLALFNKGDISKQALDQATNALQTTRSQLDAQQKLVIAAQSRVDEARAAVVTATNNYRQSLAEVDVSRSQVDESTGRLADANAAPERVGATEAQVGSAGSQIQLAQAAIHAAELELSYSKIVAPDDGYITRKAVEEGQLVQIGMPLMAISQAHEVWVIANFKETQLELMQPGQKVSIKVDAYPNSSFTGHVESVQAGTGSRFSVLPSENATGNFVKVVQRIPVKILFDSPPDDSHRLVPGMSAEPSVKVR